MEVILEGALRATNLNNGRWREQVDSSTKQLAKHDLEHSL